MKRLTPLIKAGCPFGGLIANVQYQRSQWGMPCSLTEYAATKMLALLAFAFSLLKALKPSKSVIKWAVVGAGRLGLLFGFAVLVFGRRRVGVLVNNFGFSSLPVPDNPGPCPLDDSFFRRLVGRQFRCAVGARGKCWVLPSGCCSQQSCSHLLK